MADTRDNPQQPATGELPFSIVLRGGSHILDWSLRGGKGCRPATETEVQLWQALAFRAQQPTSGARTPGDAGAFANSLCAMIGRISDALGISEEEQSCANGDEEILDRIRELQECAQQPASQPTSADGLTTLTVRTRHPQSCVLHDERDGSRWRGTDGGEWVREDSRATRVEVPDARADGLRDLRKVLLAQLANVDQELAAHGAPVPREGAGPVAWRPIETAPREGEFLVYLPHERSKIQTARFHPNAKVIGNAFAFDLTAPTHWMPLPPAPGAEAAPSAQGADARDAERLLAAIADAYGHLWHVNNEPTAPIPLYSPEKAAYEARKILRDLLTHEQRGEAINRVGRALGHYTDDAARAAGREADRG